MDSSIVEAPSLRTKKNKKRQEAGKRKAASLQAWHAEMKAARMDLIDSGYNGSFLCKKGSPIYKKSRRCDWLAVPLL